MVGYGWRSTGPRRHHQRQPDKHNAFDDEMDLRLFEILAELPERPDSGP